MQESKSIPNSRSREAIFRLCASDGCASFQEGAVRNFFLACKRVREARFKMRVHTPGVGAAQRGGGTVTNVCVSHYYLERSVFYFKALSTLFFMGPVKRFAPPDTESLDFCGEDSARIQINIYKQSPTG